MSRLRSVALVTLPVTVLLAAGSELLGQAQDSPGFIASRAISSFVVETRATSNGRHAIAWSVTDSAGRPEGIGSRFFNVLNSSSRRGRRGAGDPGASAGDPRPGRAGQWTGPAGQ